MFECILKDSLIWFPEKGFGYYPVKKSPYNAAYFEKYVGYSATEMGKKITDARIDLVKTYYTGKVVDVGIGCGQFIEAHNNAVGYDINPVAVSWLEEKSLYCNIYELNVPAATFWDSLEHIHAPDRIISKINEWVFISIPIFNGPESILSNKHFKKDEHVWYFTHYGLIHWFDCMGFDMVDTNVKESILGRENIRSYVFRRRNA